MTGRLIAVRVVSAKGANIEAMERSTVRLADVGEEQPMAVQMTGGIAAVVSGFQGLVPVAIARSVAVYAALILFAWVVFRARFEPAELRRPPKA